MTAVILILVAEPREDWEQVTTSESPSRGGSAAKEVHPVPTILPAKHGYSLVFTQNKPVNNGC